MFERLSAKEITEFIIMVLLAYNMREADRLQTIIQEAGCQNRRHELWPQFKATAENPEHALSQFMQIHHRAVGWWGLSDAGWLLIAVLIFKL